MVGQIVQVVPAVVYLTAGKFVVAKNDISGQKLFYSAILYC